MKQREESEKGLNLLAGSDGPIRDRIAYGAIGLHDYLPDRDYAAIVAPDGLYIRELRSGDVDFYDLGDDPEARSNLGSEHPRAAQLAEKLPLEHAPRPKQVHLDPETRDQLVKLGYLP